MISFSWASWQQYQGSFSTDTNFSEVILRHFRHYVGFHAIMIPVFLFLLSLLRQYYLAGPAAQTALIHTPQQKIRGWRTELYHPHLREEALSSQWDFLISTRVSKPLQTTVHPCAPYYLEGNFLPCKSFLPGFQMTWLTERGFTAKRVTQSKLTNLSLLSNPLHELKQE